MSEIIHREESYRIIGACEIKAVSALTDEHRSQVLNYLNATGYRLGLLVNFGAHGNVEWERIVK